MNYNDYFSRKIAKGNAFFNRQKQSNALYAEMASSSSVWLSGERRVGKTSIAVHVCNKLHNTAEELGLTHFVWSECDISSCATLEAAKRKILHMIAESAAQLASTNTKAKSMLGSFFARLNPELSLGGQDLAKLTLKLNPSLSVDNPIEEAILALNQLADNQNARVAMIIDEFQTLAEISSKDGVKLEWDIRAGLQKSDRVAMVFAGSKHRMMNEIFLTKNRGLYGMCRRINVFNLPKIDCIEQVEIAAQACNFTLDTDVAELIFNLTNGHPRDFSHLCLQTFENAQFNTEARKHITSEVVLDAWDTYINDIVTDELNAIIQEKQNANKRAEVATLQAIAHTRPRQIRSAEFILLVGLTGTPINSAVKNLESQGLIRKTDNQWHLCEPSFEEALIRLSEHHFDTNLIERVRRKSESSEDK